MLLGWLWVVVGETFVEITKLVLGGEVVTTVLSLILSNVVVGKNSLVV